MKIYRVFESESSHFEEINIGYFDSYDKALNKVLENYEDYEEDHRDFSKQWKKEPARNSPPYYSTHYVTIDEIEVN